MRHILPFFALLFPLPLAAQDAPAGTAPIETQSEIVTDRPDVAESGLTVGRGVYQVEAGVDVGNNDGSTAFAAPLKLRAGVTEALEVHIESGTFQWNEGAGGSVADVDLGGKWTAWRSDSGHALGVLSALTIPLQDGGAFLARPTLIAEGPLTDWLSLGVNLGATIALTERESAQDFGRFAASLGWGLPSWDKLGVFTETFGTFDEDVVQLFADGGGTYKLTPSVQLDAYARVGLVEAPSAYGGGFGVSFKVD